MLNGEDSKKRVYKIVELMFSPERSKEISDYRANHKEYSLQHVANDLGITKESVRVCCLYHGVPTRNIRFGISKIESICPQCGGIKSAGGKVCRKCHYMNNSTELTCATCGTKFRKLNSILKRCLDNGQDKFYCNLKCFGKHAGENFGVGSKNAK